MKLDEILPRREWVTLTEAATAIAFGKSETLEQVYKRQIREFDLYTDLYKKVFRAAYDCASAAAWGKDWFEKLSDANNESYPPEIVRLLELRLNEERRREIEKGKFQDAVRYLLEAGQQGKFSITGIHSSSGGRREVIPTYDLASRYAKYGEDMDEIISDAPDGNWTHVMISFHKSASIEFAPRHITDPPVLPLNNSNILANTRKKNRPKIDPAIEALSELAAEGFAIDGNQKVLLRAVVEKLGHSISVRALRDARNEFKKR